MSPSPADSAQDFDYAYAMDTTSTTTARINKFDATNFHTWKFKMQMVLEERDLWEVVRGESKWENCATALDQAAFKRKSRKALAIICLALEDTQLPLVRSASGAHDAWSRLEGHFEKKGLASKLFLRRRFFTTMMEEGEDVLENINKFKTLADATRDAVGTGDIVMSMKTPRGTKKGVLTNVWHIPKLSRNLFSVGRFTKDVGPVTFETDGCFAEAKGIKWKLGAREGKGLFKLCMTPVVPDEANVASSKIAKGTPRCTSGTFDLVTLATAV
ncbi:unnamed protein product [Phytophthora lilii]|uniref:Unnamed protein product n=1 Tax=Phytophthora lilii TaxID=2077276 RepID=A0A9W6YK16_9STRA|nr:unnamed protein product [Phytophthora lilii]